MTSQGPPELHLRNEADLDLAFVKLLRQVYAGERWALVEPHAAECGRKPRPLILALDRGQIRVRELVA